MRSVLRHPIETHSLRRACADRGFWTSCIAALLAVAYSGAFAADLPVRGPAAAPIPAAPPVYNWTGFYVGVNGGWGWSSFDTTFAPGQFPNTIDFTTQLLHTSVNSAVFGGQLGYNWQLNNWVLGVEGDFDGTSMHDTQQIAFPTARGGGAGDFLGAIDVFSATNRIDWLASVRGRIGVLWGPGLLYFTGGGAWEEVKRSLFVLDHSGVVGPPPPGTVAGEIATSATFSSVRPGFVVGGGYEWLIAPHWTVRGEYLFYNFGKSDDDVLVFPIAMCGSGPTPASACNIPVTAGKNNVNVVRFGVNYKF
jgi:outer membrane immunogenic protein